MHSDDAIDGITAITKVLCGLLGGSKIRLVSFYEGSIGPRPSREMMGDTDHSTIDPDTIIVPKSSAVLGLGADLEEDYQIDGHHSAMIKFTSSLDDPYRIIVDRLLEALYYQAGLVFGAALNQSQRSVDQRIAGTQTGVGQREELTHSAAPKDEKQRLKKKYIYSQLLRVAADAGLHEIAKRLMECGADPLMRVQEPPYDTFSDNPWIFYDGDPASNQGEDLEIANYKSSITGILRGDLTAFTLAMKRDDSQMIDTLLELEKEGIVWERDQAIT
ncbi:hypothetical protein TWF718_005930 [Orbilia javanica]|uniref:Uncharacterized protein n=1 Tax=Orbilia javanica TaxID=47235 RepID=A0AAN8RDX6_9PEZI